MRQNYKLLYVFGAVNVNTSIFYNEIASEIKSRRLKEEEENLSRSNFVKRHKKNIDGTTKAKTKGL